MNREKAEYYIDAHDAYKDYFDEKFDKDAEELWDIFQSCMVDGENVGDVADRHYISESSVVRRIKKVETFFDTIEEYLLSHQPFIKNFEGAFMYPDDFRFPRVGRKALDVFMFSVVLLQASNFNMVNFTNVNEIDKDKKRRESLIDELKDATIWSPKTGEIKVYNNIIEEKGIITFTFADLATLYLDPDGLRKIAEKSLKEGQEKL